MNRKHQLPVKAGSKPHIFNGVNLLQGRYDILDVSQAEVVRIPPLIRPH